MGLMDRQRAAKAAQGELGAAVAENCPDPASHYRTEVNRGSINMTMFGATLNQQYAKGYRLAHVFEQAGNTVQVFEHVHP